MTTCRSMTSFASAGFESNVIVCFRVEVFVELVDVVPITVALCVVQAHDLPPGLALSLHVLLQTLFHLVWLYRLQSSLVSLHPARTDRCCAFAWSLQSASAGNGQCGL